MGKRKTSRQALARFRERGHKALLRGAYAEAVNEWEKVNSAKPSMLPTATLAEAYFRRGITRFYDQSEEEAAIEDLKKALEMLPDEFRYHYHLALIYHHQGTPTRAIPHYQKAQEGDEPLKERSAYPLALALLQVGENPEEDEVWKHLSPEEQSLLQEATTFDRRPYTLSENAPPFWKGMMALDDGDLDEAEEQFKRGLAQTSNQMEVALLHYYLGVLAAQRDEMVEARRQWTEAAAGGIKTESLTLNLGESFHRLAEARLEAGEVKAALTAAQEALRHRPGKRSLQFLVSQAHQQLGYQAAKQGDWETAEKHWRKAYDLEDGNFRLAFNLALCYERQERYIAAGETWREVLRRRPRLDDDPDALDDEQVAQIWKRAAEAYVKAGEYDEAVHVYRQAVKYNPAHLPTRMALVENLMNNGQFEAAENELGRILERDPDYVPALMQMGDILVSSGSWWRRGNPARYWKRALELEPNNVEAREALIDYYLEEASHRGYWGHVEAALEAYEEILTFAPHHGATLALMGRSYLDLGQREKAWEYLQQALKYEENLDQYFSNIIICLAYHEDAWAWELIEEAEEKIKIPLLFYAEIIQKCTEIKREDLIDRWTEHLIDRAAPEDEPMLVLGETLMFTSELELAETFLERAQEAGEDPARVHMALAMVSARRGEHKRTRHHLYQAEKIARRQGDNDLVQSIRDVRETLIAMPPGFLEMILNNPLGPDGPLPFPDFF